MNWVWHILGTASFRNGALVIAAIITLVISIRRAIIANDDKKTSIKQADVALKQSQTSEAGLNIDRFQKGSEMLGSGNPAVTQGGILILSELASQNMLTHFEQVQRVLCSFVRSSKRDSGSSGTTNTTAPDIKTAIFELSKLRENSREFVDFCSTQFDLREVKLEDADLRGLNLRGAKLHRSSFRDSLCENLDLSDAECRGVNFERTKLSNTNFKNVDLSEALNLNYSQLIKAKNVDKNYLEKRRIENDCLIAELDRKKETYLEMHNMGGRRPKKAD